MIINKREFIDYSLLTLLIASSGFSYFHSPIVTVPLFALLFSFFIIRKKMLNVDFLFFIVALLTITLLQAFQFQFFSIITTIGLFIMIMNAYLIVKNLGDKFISYYINILYYLAIISLVIYFSMLIIPPIKILYSYITPIFHIFNFAHSPHESIVIYNFGPHPERINYRNSGPFWEPGAFAGYLILAYVFNFFISEKRIDKKSIVLFVAMLTTLSTTAYLALASFFFFVYFRKIKNIIFKMGILIVMIFAFFYAYNTFDFLGEKIESQIEYAQQKGIKGSADSQRFLSIMRDVYYLKGNEFIGRGGNNATRYDLAPGGEFVISTVGFTDVIVRYGIPMFLIIIYFLYKSICAYLSYIQERNQLYCLGIFTAILFTLFSEVYFTYSMYWSLLFLKFVYSTRHEDKM